jgi:hypothetical protein
MSQMWHRMRGLANPVPAVEPGGIEQNEWDPQSDVTLPDDHFSRLHNPANGRVPPQLPGAITRPQWPDFPLRQYARFFRNTPAFLNESLSFQAQSVRIDNFSSHWIYIVSAGMYIPPFVWGSVFWINPAVSVAGYVISPPLNHIDATPTVESQIVSIWYEDQLSPSAGLLGPST